MIGCLSLVGCAGYVLLAVCRGVGWRYAGVFLAASGVFPAIANVMPWCLGNHRSDTKRGVGIVLLNVIGQCGSLLGTRVFPVGEGLYYTKGMIICAGFMLCSAVLAFGLRVYFKYWNDRWDVEVSGSRDSSAESVGGEKSEEGRGAPAAAGGRTVAAVGDPEAAEISEGHGGWENSAAWRYAL